MKIFTINGVEKCVYDVRNSFPEEEISTIKLLAYENNVSPSDIKVTLAYR
mgnify:CR=1 FL=1